MLDEELPGNEGIRRLKRVEYERMLECGLFADENVELLRGFLVRMSPQGGRHSNVVARLARLLTIALGDRADVFSHSPFAAGGESLPEPDTAVVPHDPNRSAHPDRAWLLVEVADSSLQKDREAKAPLYASAGVPEYWVVDLDANVVEVFARPSDSGYRSTTRLGIDATLAIRAFPDLPIAIAEFLR